MQLFWFTHIMTSRKTPRNYCKVNNTNNNNIYYLPSQCYLRCPLFHIQVDSPWPSQGSPCSNEAHKATCTQVHNRELPRARISSHVINRGKRLNFHCQGLKHMFFTLSHPKQGYFVATVNFPLINIYKPSFIASTCICSHK